MARRLSRLGFYVLLMLVGVWLVLNMPGPEDVGETPRSGLVRFSVDHSTTEIHRLRQQAMKYHRRARNLLRKGSPRSRRLFRRALQSYEKAGQLAAKRPRAGYLHASIARGIQRVESDLRELSNQSQ